MATYVIGQCVRVTASFTSSNTPTDPTMVTFLIKTPAGVVSSYVYGVDTAPVKDGVGVYHMDVFPNAAGTWTYRVEGTGTAAAALESSFSVFTSVFYS
jgi:uncharacterized protein YfaS (alpha-2-macroglobulin family)